jgi:hypothetical protein
MKPACENCKSLNEGFPHDRCFVDNRIVFDLTKKCGDYEFSEEMKENERKQNNRSGLK